MTDEFHNIIEDDAIIKVANFTCDIYTQIEVMCYDSKKKPFEDTNIVIRVPRNCAYRIKMSSSKRFKFLAANEKTKGFEKPYICRFFDNQNLYTFGSDESDWCVLKFFELGASDNINIEVYRINGFGTKLDRRMNGWFDSILRELKEK